MVGCRQIASQPPPLQQPPSLSLQCSSPPIPFPCLLSCSEALQHWLQMLSSRSTPVVDLLTLWHAPHSGTRELGEQGSQAIISCLTPQSLPASSATLQQNHCSRISWQKMTAVGVCVWGLSKTAAWGVGGGGWGERGGGGGSCRSWGKQLCSWLPQLQPCRCGMQ